jgi:hypothetical protein
MDDDDSERFYFKEEEESRSREYPVKRRSVLCQNCSNRKERISRRKRHHSRDRSPRSISASKFHLGNRNYSKENFQRKRMERMSAKKLKSRSRSRPKSKSKSKSRLPKMRRKIRFKEDKIEESHQNTNYSRRNIYQPVFRSISRNSKSGLLKKDSGSTAKKPFTLAKNVN